MAMPLMARHGRPLLFVLSGATLDERIQHMDDAQVDMQVLSPSNLMPYLENETDAREAARVLNDSYAELAQRMPRRFNSCLILPPRRPTLRPGRSGITP